MNYENIILFQKLSIDLLICIVMALYVFFSLDPESKEQLVEVIEKLLGDKTTVSEMYLL